MTLYALEDIDDAWDATRAFLSPIDRSRWLKLAVVVFFLGGPGANLNIFQLNVPAGGEMPTGRLPPVDVGPRFWLLVAAVVGVLIVIGLVFLLVGSIMEFVLVESLRREEVAVRRYWGRRWRQGVRLFGFRLVIGLLVLGGAAVLAALFLVPVVLDVGPGPDALSGGVTIAALLLLVPVLIVLAVLVGLVNGFTTVFVVPVMVLADCGVLAGWRRLWPTIAAHPWQYLTYAVLGVVLTVVAGLLVGIAVGVAALVLVIPFGVLAAIGVLLWFAVPPLGLGVLGFVGLLFALAILGVLAVVQVPVTTYLRYYALLVLGDVDEGLDLIPERRAAIRSEDHTEG